MPVQDEFANNGVNRYLIAGGATLALLFAVVGVVLWQTKPTPRVASAPPPPDMPAYVPPPTEQVPSSTPPPAEVASPPTVPPKPTSPAPGQAENPAPPKPPTEAPVPPMVVVQVLQTAPPPREVVISPPPPKTVAKLPDPTRPPPAPPVPLRLDDRGFAIHSLGKRIDTSNHLELEKSLLVMREVTLDPVIGPRVSTNLSNLAKELKKKNLIYSGTVLAAGGRPDLAGLPFRMGLEAVLVREKAQAMNSLSKQLRASVQSCIPSADDPRPNTDELFSTLISEKKGNFRNRDKQQWNRAEAVPCVVQMLQAENQEVRRMSCELLRKLDAREATEALTKWAVFDTDAGNRAAAVDALRQRNRKEVSELLARHLQYPWPQAVEHACEALVALNGQEAIPELARIYGQKDPDAPFRVELPGKNSGYFRQEVVRVNHPRNCIMCHSPSFNEADLVRGAAPNPDFPLPPPATVPSYYNGGGQFVAAEVTYLQQDFSLVQPVVNPGNWPAHQRYDYFVAIRPNEGAVDDTPNPKGRYQRAIRFALKELSGHDPDDNESEEWLNEQRKKAVETGDPRVAAVAKFLSLTTNPEALAALKNQEFVKPLLSTTPGELAIGILAMQKAHGTKASRLALIAYLDPLTRTGEPTTRAKANKLLAVVLSATADAQLSKAMKDAIE
jgi:hypothetical protein